MRAQRNHPFRGLALPFVPAFVADSQLVSIKSAQRVFIFALRARQCPKLLFVGSLDETDLPEKRCKISPLLVGVVVVEEVNWPVVPQIRGR